MAVKPTAILNTFRSSSFEEKVGGNTLAIGEWSFAKDARAVSVYVHRDDRRLPNDPQLDNDIVESIPEKFYEVPEVFDHSHEEVKKLLASGTGGAIDMHHLEMLMQQRKRQLQVVSKKMSYQILEKQSGYVQELERVQTLQKDLVEALKICKDSRSHLEIAKQCNTESVLELFGFYRRKCHYSNVLKRLGHITTLQKTDLLIQEMLSEGDFPGAVQLCLECRQVAASYRQYTCISQLSTKLNDTLVMIEEQLDRALASICLTFQPQVYHKIQLAFKMIGKSQTCLDQLKMHYSSLLHYKSFSLVLGYAVLNPDSKLSESQLQRMQYAELCTQVSSQLFTACLSDLCKTVWNILHSYYQMCRWHEQNMTLFYSPEAPRAEIDHIETFFNKKLQHDGSRMWQDVQTKVKTFLHSIDLCHNFSSFSFDEFIKILDLVDKLTEVGRQFCESPSIDLQECIKQQSAAYFKIYHRSCMSDLKLFLETDLWELCPIKSHFKLTDLHDFQFLNKLRSATIPSYSQQPSLGSSIMKQLDSGNVSKSSENESAENASKKDPGCYFESETENPFAVLGNDFAKKKEDILADINEESLVPEEASDSDDDIAPELRADFIDELSGEVYMRTTSNSSYSMKGDFAHGRRSTSSFSSKRSYSRQLSTCKIPLITNTTLSILRYFGKYMQMMTLLKPVAFDVLICMSQLFDYYLHTVHQLFVFKEVNPKLYSNKLHSLLDRISANLISHSKTPHGATSAFVLSSAQHQSSHNASPAHVGSQPAPNAALEKEKFPPATPEDDLLIDSPESLFNFIKRMVACESVIFLAQQFETLRGYLQSHIPHNKVMFLNQFFTHTVATCVDLRCPVYNGIAARAIKYNSLIQEMANVKWDLKEIVSEQSPYVEMILAEFMLLRQKLVDLSHEVPLSKVAVQLFMEQCLKLTSWALIEGYSNVKKCTNEGRALMQLDFQIYLVEISKITDVQSPIPDQQFVEAYIKAFYLPETEFEKWVFEHKEFSPKQLLSIVNCASSLQVNKKLRHKLQTAIEESEKQQNQNPPQSHGGPGAVGVGNSNSSSAIPSFSKR